MALTRRTGLYFYDGKKLWEKYMSMGKAASYSKMVAWCVSEGLGSPATGGANESGIRFAMWRYALRNPEEAYKSYKEWQMADGNFPNFYEFCLDVWDHAYTQKTAAVSEKEKRTFRDKYLANSGL